MICNTIGLTADSFESIYVTGGAEVAEVYGGLNYADPIFYKTQTMTGVAPLMYDSYPGGLTDYTILGNSYQDGVPDPDNPVEVQSVGERTENLFTPAVYDKYIDPGDGTLKNGIGYKTSDYILIESNSYYCSAVVTSTAYYQCDYALYDSDKNYLRGGSAFRFYDQPGTIKKATIDTTSAAFIRISYNGVLENEMLNIGSEYVPYEPYGYKIPITISDGTNSQTYPIYLSEPLRKIGDYADEIDFKAGTVVRRIKEYIVTGDENDWRIYERMYYRAFEGIYAPALLCNRFRYSTSIVAEMWAFVKGANYNILFKYDNNNDLNGFKEWLKHLYNSGTPMKVYRVITPTTESITLPQIPTINGQNTLSIGTTLQPSTVSITGHIKPSSIYGNLTDVNGTYIHDKDGVQLKVTG